MKFGILCDNKKQAKAYFKETEKSFKANASAQQYVEREHKFFDFTSDMIVGIKFSTLFPIKMLQTISMYTVAIAILFQWILGFGLIVGLVAGLFLNLPSLLESRRVVFMIIKKQMKKHGYKGRVWLLNDKEFKRSVQWD